MKNTQNHWPLGRLHCSTEECIGCSVALQLSSNEWNKCCRLSTLASRLPLHRICFQDLIILVSLPRSLAWFFSLSYLLSGIAINVDMSPLTILRSSLLHLSHITFYPPDAPFIVEFETNHCINSPPCTMLPFFFSHPYLDYLTAFTYVGRIA